MATKIIKYYAVKERSNALILEVYCELKDAKWHANKDPNLDVVELVRTDHRPQWKYVEINGQPTEQRKIIAQDCREESALLKRVGNNKYVDAFHKTCGKQVDAAAVWRWMYLEELE